MGGTPIEEFVGLRSKMYSIKSTDGRQTNTAKGVSKTVSENVLTHEDYRESLFKKKSMKHQMTKIANEWHQLYTVDLVKTSLSPFNDKKYIYENGVTHSFGHFEL
jgi:hypothetical protein